MAIWGVRVGSIRAQLACRAACILQMPMVTVSVPVVKSGPAV